MRAGVYALQTKRAVQVAHFALLEQQELELASHQKRLDVDQRKMLRRVSDWSPRAGNLQTRAAAFTTYEALPLAREKAELLRTFE